MPIRTATVEDLEAIAAVERCCFPEAEAASPEALAGRLAVYSNHFWLLEEQGSLLGFINGMVTDNRDLQDCMYARAELHNEQGAWQMIFGLDVLPQYRRQGCAARLLRHVIAVSVAEGRKGLVLTCKAALVPYYAKFGFVSEGISESGHGGVVWHQMRLLLD